MTSKLIRYIILFLVVGFLAYKSVYFRKLDAKPATVNANLDPPAFAKEFWVNKFPRYIDSAMDMGTFFSMLEKDPAGLIAKYSHTQGIGNTAYFLVQGDAAVEKMDGDDVKLSLTGANPPLSFKLSCGNYFGNGVRDVSGAISMGDFKNTMEFNDVSAALNKIVRTEIVEPFRSKAAAARNIHFTGCVELNKDQPQTKEIAVLPVRIKIID